MPRLLSEAAVVMTVVAPTADNQTSGSDTQLTQANFDTNMVIILAALLCALICALGLNSMVRCVLRCGHQFGIETAEQTAAPMSATGLKKSALKKLPVAVYETTATGNKESDMSTCPSDIECPICLGEFIDGEKVRVLPKCNHRFHVSCIDTWLRSHSSCPNCRHSVLEVVGSSSSKAAEREGIYNGGGVLPQGGGDNGGQEEHVVVELRGGS